jgi:arsenate reductase
MSKPRVLFLCIHNSARSQMAEGLLRARAGGQFEVFSAGSDPTSVQPFAVRALQDEGIDISQQRSKNVSELIQEHFDFVITLCAEEVCPVFPNAVRRLHWSLDDPAAVDGGNDEKLEAFGRTVRELKKHLDAFILETANLARP